MIGYYIGKERIKLGIEWIRIHDSKFGPSRRGIL